MSTKNLARTVIEVGRSGYSKFNRSEYNRKERRKNRQILHMFGRDYALTEEILVATRKKAEIDQLDKLNPAWRWLSSHCGKTWDHVRSLMFKKFDVRTIPGRHVVYDHMLGSIATPTHHNSRLKDFLVNENGVLVPQPFKKYTRQKSLREYKHIRSWLKSRYIGRRNNCLYWFVPVDVVFWDRGIRLNGHKPAYRQDRRLTLMEENVFFALSRKARNELFEEGSPFIPNLVI